MKATIDIPDEVYRRVKARSALEGRTVREVTTELYRQWLGDLEAQEPPPPAPTEGEPGVKKPPGAEEKDPRTAWLEGWEELGRRIADSAGDPRTTVRIIVEDRRLDEP